MLNLLRTLSQSIAPSMADMWEQEIPLLVQYLEGEVPTLCALLGHSLVMCLGSQEPGVWWT